MLYGLILASESISQDKVLHCISPENQGLPLPKLPQINRLKWMCWPWGYGILAVLLEPGEKANLIICNQPYEQVEIKPVDFLLKAVTILRIGVASVDD